MISHIRIENFKSLQDIKLKLGAFNLFIGANASGKSNFFDALRVLQGIGNEFTVAEILDGKSKAATHEEWERIRGGSRNALFVPMAGATHTGSTIHIGINAPFQEIWKKKPGSDLSYDVWIDPEQLRVSRETIDFPGDTTYKVACTGEPPMLQAAEHRHGMTTNLDPARPSLSQLIRHDAIKSCCRTRIKLVQHIMADAQRIQLEVQHLRSPSTSPTALRMGERGENFAALVAEIIRDRDAYDAYLQWLRELAPLELDGIETVPGPTGDPYFAMREGGRQFFAPVLSDGTLRFAALAAAFFQPSMPSRITIEEIENGFHPSRIRTLLELLRSQSKRGEVQVFATTHSPTVLAWLKEEEYSTTFLCRRDPATGASRIVPLTDVPRLIELAQRQSLADLFVEQWPESAL